MYHFCWFTLFRLSSMKSVKEGVPLIYDGWKLSSRMTDGTNCLCSIASAITKECIITQRSSYSETVTSVNFVLNMFKTAENAANWEIYRQIWDVQRYSYEWGKWSLIFCFHYLKSVCTVAAKMLTEEHKSKCSAATLSFFQLIQHLVGGIEINVDSYCHWQWDLDFPCHAFNKTINGMEAPHFVNSAKVQTDHLNTKNHVHCFLGQKRGHTDGFQIQGQNC